MSKSTRSCNLLSENIKSICHPKGVILIVINHLITILTNKWLAACEGSTVSEIPTKDEAKNKVRNAKKIMCKIAKTILVSNYVAIYKIFVLLLAI